MIHKKTDPVAYMKLQELAAQERGEKKPTPSSEAQTLSILRSEGYKKAQAEQAKKAQQEKIAQANAEKFKSEVASNPVSPYKKGGATLGNLSSGLSATNPYSSSNRLKHLQNSLNNPPNYTGMTESQRKSSVETLENELKNIELNLNPNRIFYDENGNPVYGVDDETRKTLNDRKYEIINTIAEIKKAGASSDYEINEIELEAAKAMKDAVLKEVLDLTKSGSVMSEGSSDYERLEYINEKNQKAVYVADVTENRKNLWDDEREFGDVVLEDSNSNGDFWQFITNHKNWGKDFVNQWRANYRSNELSREADKAYNRYIANPTKENLEIAMGWETLANKYVENNAQALDNKNVKASWLTKDLAGYLPQAKDQAVPELIGAGLGGAIGYAFGVPDKGAAVGAGIATAGQSYEVVRGSVYRTLIAQGVDEQTALQAAEDEALINSLIEGGETALSMLLAGGGKAFGAVGNAAKASVAKGSTNAATRLVANMATKSTTKATAKAAKAASRPLWNKAIRTVGDVALQGGTEYLEEFTQGAVSKANREQALATVEKEVGQFGKGRRLFGREYSAAH